MNINKVTFGNFSIGAQRGNAKKSEGKEEAFETTQKSESKNVDVQAFSNALDIVGLQNKAQISRAEKPEINPANYLTEDRISDIEALMDKFENGVGAIADAIENELPGVFGADTKNALAAKIYAQE